MPSPHTDEQRLVFADLTQVWYPVGVFSYWQAFECSSQVLLEWEYETCTQFKVASHFDWHIASLYTMKFTIDSNDFSEQARLPIRSQSHTYPGRTRQ
jgi:hypothetical protein